MRGFKFIHTADLHLDSPFKGIGQLSSDFRERLLSATFQAFQNLVDLALQEEVDFILIAGDLFDGAELSLQAQLFCQQQFCRLTEVGIQVYLAHGNHDHLGSWRADLEWPEGVFIFPAGEVENHPVLRQGQELARIYGVSYPQQHVKENYLPQFQIDDQAPYQIGVLHTNVGSISGYADYAPCTVTELTRSGMDYWALGHVHSYQVLHSADPLVIYPGTTQGRHPGETGPKGCCLVEVAVDGSTQHQWVEVDQLRWLHLSVEIGGLSGMDELITTLRTRLQQRQEDLRGTSCLFMEMGKAEVVGGIERVTELAEQNERQQMNGEDDANPTLDATDTRGVKVEQGQAQLISRDAIVRISITGRGQLHSKLRRPGVVTDLEELLREEFATATPALWVESIRLDTRPDLDLAELRSEESLLGDFLKLTRRGQELEPDLLAELEESLAGLIQDRRLQKILGELDPADWRRLIRKSEEVGIELFGLEVE